MMPAFALMAALSGSPDVLISDREWFLADYEACLAMRRCATQHREIMKDEIKSWNPPEVFLIWERDIEWRRRCWDALEDAKSPGSRYNDSEWRLQRLAVLKILLGDEAYFGGMMPSPLPPYRR